MNAISSKEYIIGHLDWNSRVRFAVGIAVSCVLFATLGFMVLAPWDPQGAISLQFVDNETFFLIRLVALLLVAGVFSSVIMDARLPMFGTFSAAIGMGIPLVKTAGMTYVMVRLQVGKEFEHSHDLWPYLMMETLAWSAVLMILAAGTMLVERWLKKGDDESIETNQPQEKSAKKKKENSLAQWLRGLGGMLITAILALALISVLAANGMKGQVTFAVIAGFFVAALVAEQVTENDHPFWQVLAIPVVAMAAYGYTWQNPTRPAGLETLLNIAPTNLARVLPAEYIFMGAIGAIFGTWTSHRMRYAKEHG
jgi:hypothetical protein